MDLLVKQAIPYKSVSYVYHFLFVYYNLNSFEKTKYFFPVFTLLLFKIIQYMGLFFWDKPLSTFWQIALNDFVRLAHLPINLYLLLIGFTILTFYYLHLHFFEQIYAVDMLNDVMNTSTTNNENPEEYANKCPSILQFNFRPHKEQPVAQHTIKFIASFLRLWRPFIIFLGKCHFLQNITK